MSETLRKQHCYNSDVSVYWGVANLIEDMPYLIPYFYYAEITMTQKKIEVLIIDDDSIARQGLVYILSKCPDIIVTGEAGEGAAGLKKMHEGKYDVVVLDLFMPGKDTLDVLKEAKVHFPKLPILILTTCVDDSIALRFLKAGSSGFISKSATFEDISTAIRKVYAGERYLSKDLTEKLAYHSLGDKTKAQQELTDREYQIMVLIASGKQAADIARELYISPKTVSTHRSNIIEKMKLKNNAEIMRYCLTNELVRK